MLALQFMEEGGFEMKGEYISCNSGKRTKTFRREAIDVSDGCTLTDIHKGPIRICHPNCFTIMPKL